ncbi:MAG: glutamine--tRNA ligase/YqeY domain fusion protein [Pseudomonadales bacterium]|nr:glutamine--tRNA ligase/YqeY domain fusion protein [Pseudomonadales bacterium]MDP4639845.1 glutamine--tRNA ligase/YqeY domain fusion protein [Pseudomonadales bacterium]MDP4765677.1 glutamine--tRNA ligase/YqeY domain fusion protein [Pseudomonadales bacterium]MDP4875369.1 glutamine--tRNA ligase/YqeY domain fusion protein [Pseudomonadales bacterium]MDP4911362.1 glutamine--tRNA ligase/YqeY domain fusion protein [Pseudomonadales bacterium]
MSETLNTEIEKYPANFIRTIIEKDLAAGKNNGQVVTRFPPEPNGYLHIGHAKAICLSFGIAQEFNGSTFLRFDDTNPLKENVEFMESMKTDISWLGFQWREIRNASDYFEELYQFAEALIEDGKAYVDSLSADEIREYRGTLTAPGRNSPFRDRSVAENLDLFRRMRAGEFKDGEHVLRLKIDMASPNMNMRDPAIYRIRHFHHHQTGDKWCIYPLYDYTHCISDSLEGITHSLCDLGFEAHRPLYDWVLDNIRVNCHPQQIEFSRLNLQYTVMSKRKLKQLVDEQLVSGWDDPRLPTIAGLRRRGYTPTAIRDFCRRIGVTKSDNNVELAMLQSVIREDLEDTAPRVMGVLNPLKVVISNYPAGQTEQLLVANHPKNDALGSRTLPFTRELYIDQDDFREEANRKYKRLVSGGEVRLRYGYVICANEVIKDAAGNITELHCTYDPATLGENPVDRKVRGVIHWVSAEQGLPAEIRLYEPLFTVDWPDASDSDYRDLLNPDSLRVVQGYVEPSLASATVEQRFQFEREGYFCIDNQDSRPEKLVFNRVVGLRDSWAKIDAGE